MISSRSSRSNSNGDLISTQDAYRIISRTRKTSNPATKKEIQLARLIQAEEFTSTMTSESALLTPPKLNDKNWTSWSFLIKQILKHKKIESLITTEPTAAQKTDPTYLGNNTLVIIIIGNALPDEMIQAIQHLDFAYEIWTRLVSIHEGSGSNKFMRIMEELIHVGDSATGIAQISGRVARLVQQLKNCKHDEEETGKFFLCKALSSEYDSIKPVLADKKLNEAIDFLNGYETSHKIDFDKTKVSIKSEPTEHTTALVTSTKFGKPYSAQFNPKSQDEIVWCRYCKLVGHTIDQCRKRKHFNNRQDNVQGHTSHSNNYTHGRVNNFSHTNVNTPNGNSGRNIPSFTANVFSNPGDNYASTCDLPRRVSGL